MPRLFALPKAVCSNRLAVKVYMKNSVAVVLSLILSKEHSKSSRKAYGAENASPDSIAIKRCTQRKGARY